MKLWGGRFAKSTDSEVNDFNSSIRFDGRMYAQDIKGSIAHATMLGKAGVISEKDSELIVKTLGEILTDIENGKVNGVTASDVQKILNLKHAWEFILDKDVLQVNSDYSILCHIAKLVNEGFFASGGRIRGVPVTIGGTSYIPPLPIETVVVENILEIISKDSEPIDTAIELCLYCMKTQKL